MSIERAEGIRGWMARNELSFLARVAARADRVLEVGSFHGRSTRALGDHCPGVVYAVDPWGRTGDYLNEDGSSNAISKLLRDDAAWTAFNENLGDLIVLGRVIPVRAEFVKAYAAGVWTPESFDFIFLDGDHRESTVRAEIEIARRLLRRGGVLAGHDYGHPDWPGVKVAVDEAFESVSLTRSIWCVRI